MKSGRVLSIVWALLVLAACGDDSSMGMQLAPDAGDEADSAVAGDGDGDADAGADGGEPDAMVDASEPDGEPTSDVVVPDDAPAPVIPELDGDCPDFATGTQQIMGLQTEIVAGEVGDTKGPLLFTFHGTGGSGALALLQLPQSVQDDIVSQGGLVIAPSDDGMVREGQDVTFVLGVWYDIAEVAYADHVVACAVRNHNIDPRRIYVTGCSAGGLMASVLSIERASYIAAAAPNSGGLTSPQFMFDTDEHAPAVMAMHGGDSDMVIVKFSDTTKIYSEQLVPAGSFFVECNHMSGHCGASPELHERAWEFMKAHPFGIAPEPYADGLPSTFPDYCTINE